MIAVTCSAANYLRARGVVREDCHSFYDRLVSKIAIADLAPEWIVRSQGFRRDRLIITKRVIELVVSTIGLIVSAPLTLVTAVAIKLDSPGPIFYRHERVGRNNEVFTIYKFRSMSKVQKLMAVQFGPLRMILG
jgi:hypothetical protein